VVAQLMSKRIESEPSKLGSQDQFGLKRHGDAIVVVLLEGALPRLSECLQHGLQKKHSPANYYHILE